METRANFSEVPVQAFAAKSEDGNRLSVGAVGAKPLPAQAATVPVPQAATQEPPVQSRPGVGIVEAKPLPARRTTPPAPEAPAAEVRACQSTSMALLLVTTLLLVPPIQAGACLPRLSRLKYTLCHCQPVDLICRGGFL